MPPLHMGDTQENRVILWNGPSHHLKYHLQLKTKDDLAGEPVTGGFQSTVEERMIVMQIVSTFSIGKFLEI